MRRFAWRWRMLWSRMLAGSILTASSFSRALSWRLVSRVLEVLKGDLHSWTAKKSSGFASLCTTRGMMAGPSFTRASNSGPLALAVELEF